jgi:hypothetical protein
MEKINDSGAAPRSPTLGPWPYDGRGLFVYIEISANDALCEALRGLLRDVMEKAPARDCVSRNALDRARAALAKAEPAQGEQSPAQQDIP